VKARPKSGCRWPVGSTEARIKSVVKRKVVWNIKTSLCSSWLWDEHREGEEEPVTSALLLSPRSEVIYCAFQKHFYTNDPELCVHFRSVLMQPALDHFIERAFRQLHDFSYLLQHFHIGNNVNFVCGCWSFSWVEEEIALKVAWNKLIGIWILFSTQSKETNTSISILRQLNPIHDLFLK
jgi:hypothetical protein